MFILRLTFYQYKISVTHNISICKADIRNPLSLLAHERSRFATCQWELLTPTDISIPLTHRLVLYTLEAGDCLFCIQIIQPFSVFLMIEKFTQIVLCKNTEHILHIKRKIEVREIINFLPPDLSSLRRTFLF